MLSTARSRSIACVSRPRTSSEANLAISLSFLRLRREKCLGMKKGLLVVISGPSGAGKTAICERLCQGDGIARAVTATTRAMRAGEVDGIDYHFLDIGNFEEMVDRGGFLEHAEVHKNLYGSPIAELEEQLETTDVVLLNIDVQGAQQLMNRGVDALSIFLEPPSLAELQRRLESRGEEEKETIELRMSDALEELEMKAKYDHCVVNDVLDLAADRVLALIEESRAARRTAGDR